MNKDEQKILHGLYYHHQMIGEHVFYSSAQIRWLTLHPLREGANWVKDGRLQQAESRSTENYLANIALTTAEAQRPIRYLSQSGYIDLEIQNGGFRIALTQKGADQARELHTSLGRLNYFYKRNKDGVVWLLLTALTSTLTSLLVNHFNH